MWSMLLAAAGFSLALCIALAPLAPRFGLVDHPSSRKLHSDPVPLVGGVAIFLALFIVLLSSGPLSRSVQPLLLACGLLMLAGLADDRRHLSPVLRFAIQISACLLMIFMGGVVLKDFGSLVWAGTLSLGWLSVPLTIFAAIGVINSFNMIDGMDGLSSMVFMIACIAMAWLAAMAGRDANVLLLGVAAAAVFGFSLLNTRLPWKRNKAFVYLGDSGSIFLGLFLAWQFIDLGNGDDRAFAPMTAVWLFGLPMLDTTYLMRRRWRRGGSAFDADQFHLHHAFLKAGFSVFQTWAAIAALVLLSTVIGLAGHLLGWPEYLMFDGYIVCGLFYYHFMDRCWRKKRFLGRKMATEAASN
jgi:undecaprenyl-phosphate alpha-N-acetylglucosaminyl 1-phosphatetransferase